MLRNMITSLVKHERIETTFPKAKAVKILADRVVNLGKRGTFNARKSVGAILREPETITKVFNILAERYKVRPGGFTRIIRTRYRRGDNALMAYIEFVDRPGEIRPARKPQVSLAEIRAEHAKMFPPTLMATNRSPLQKS